MKLMTLIISTVLVFFFSLTLKSQTKKLDTLTNNQTGNIVAASDEYEDEAPRSKKKKKSSKRVEVSEEDSDYDREPASSPFFGGDTGIGLSTAGPFGAMPSIIKWNASRTSAMDYNGTLTYAGGSKTETTATIDDTNGSLTTALRVRYLMKLLTKESFHFYWGVPGAIQVNTGTKNIVTTKTGNTKIETNNGMRFSVGTGILLGSELNFSQCNCFLKNVGLSLEMGINMIYNFGSTTKVISTTTNETTNGGTFTVGTNAPSTFGALGVRYYMN